MRTSIVGSLAALLAFANGCALVPSVNPDPANAEGGTAPDGGTASNQDGGTPPGAGGWRAYKMPVGKEREAVGAVYCTDPNKCVVATRDGEGGASRGLLYAANANAFGALLMDGAYKGEVSAVTSVLGDISFIGFQKSRDRLIARLSVGSGYVSAVGDMTIKSSWSAVSPGKTSGDSMPGNFQAQLQLDASGRASLITSKGFVYASNAAPGPSTVWTKLWSPTARPAVPADFAALYRADPTLCDSDVTISSFPPGPNTAFIGADAAIMLHPAGGAGQDGTAKPGMCVSLDQGKRFYSVPFAGVPQTDDAGPHGVTCTDNNHCVAFHGLDFSGNAYMYVTNNAMTGKAAVWTKSALPEGMEAASGVSLRTVFFAPDGVHGFCVGDVGTKALMLSTADGGKTWKDRSGEVQNIANHVLVSGFALDKDHVWIGGRFGTLIATDTAQN